MKNFRIVIKNSSPFSQKKSSESSAGKSMSRVKYFRYIARGQIFFVGRALPSGYLQSQRKKVIEGEQTLAGRDSGGPRPKNLKISNAAIFKDT